MSDIVERLKGAALEESFRKPEETLHGEAAAEIEKLRAENKDPHHEGFMQCENEWRQTLGFSDLGETKIRLDQMRAENAELKAKNEMLEFIEGDCLNLECHSAPTGGDDSEVTWAVYGHYMAPPQKRQRGFGFTVSEAIQEAMNNEEY